MTNLKPPPVLPLELIESIAHQLPFHDKKQLSSTCSGFRQFFEPEIFKTVKLTNLEDTVDAQVSIVEKYGRLIDTIYFQGHSTPEDDFDWTLSLDRRRPLLHDIRSSHSKTMKTHSRLKRALPEPIAGFLSGRSLPKLRKAVVHFDYGWYTDAWKDCSSELGVYWAFASPCSVHSCPGEERKHKWRALMAETWHALSFSNIRTLIAHQLPPISTSVFCTDEWENFVGRLEHFELDLIGFNDGYLSGGRPTFNCNTLGGYPYFLRRLHRYFYNDLHNIKSFKLDASLDLTIGYIGRFGTRQVLESSGQMPNLENLELKNLFIEYKMVRFIRHHSLKSLRMEHCMVAAGNEFDGPLTWASIFETLSESHNSRTLIRLDIQSEASLGKDKHASADGSDSCRVDEILRQHPKTKVFNYSYMDNGGFIHENEQAIAEAVVAGHDQKAYEALMATVRKNAEINSST